MKSIHLLVILLLGLTMVTADSKKGGFADIEVDDVKTTGAAAAAVSTLAGVAGASNPVSPCGKNIDLVGVEKAESQVVAGTQYKLTLRLATHTGDDCQTQVEKVCEDIYVWERLPFMCPGDESCHELVQQEHIKCKDAAPALDYTARELKHIIDEKEAINKNNEAIIKQLEATIRQKEAEIQRREAIIQNQEYCPIDGNWSEFGQWSSCNETCGVGWKTRARTCTSPAPKFGGKDCQGTNMDIQNCVEIENCPIDGGWSDYSGWSICSQTCGNGSKVRSKTCTQPQPQFGGEECQGEETETETCFLIENCPPSTILIESMGGAAEWQGYRMGYYDRINTTFNRRPVFKQRSGSSHIYHHEELESWRVGPTVGGSFAGLKVPSENLTPPTKGWLHWGGGEWLTDSTVRLSTSPPDPSSSCTSIQVAATGPAGTAQGDSMGLYRWDGEWLNGHKFFKKTQGNIRYLRINTGSTTWGIDATKDSEVAGIQSGRGTTCPCRGAGPSSREGVDGWRYGDGDVWHEDRSIQVTCV